MLTAFSMLRLPTAGRGGGFSTVHAVPTHGRHSGVQLPAARQRAAKCDWQSPSLQICAVPDASPRSAGA